MNEFDPTDTGNEVTAPHLGVTAANTASQQREIAEIQTKYIMAQRFPRNVVRCIDKITNDFSRPRLAELASYEYAKGGTTITGGSIHAAQAIAQTWGNIDFGFQELSRGIGPDGTPYSEVRSYAHDLETRAYRPVTFLVPHRRDTKRGGYRLKDEREIYELVANMAQRRVRGCIFAVIPQDVIDTALEQAATTLRARADTSPEALAKMLETFDAFGVTQAHIEALIQRRLEAITPAQVVRLKRIYVSLRDEVSTPESWFDMGPLADVPDPPADRTQAAREAIRKVREKPAGPSTFADFSAAIKNASDKHAAAEILDASRGQVSPDEADDLAGLYHVTWDE